MPCVASSYSGDVFHAQIADASPACIWILNPLGRIVHVNQAARRFQPSPPPPHEMAWRDAWPADCRASIDRGVAEAQAGRPFAFRTRFPSDDGAGVYLDTTISAVRDETGGIVRLLVKAEDVTAETESAAFLHTVIEVLPLALTVKDARSGRFILANRAAEAMFGSGTALAGLTAADVLPATFADWTARTGPGLGPASAVHEFPTPAGMRLLSATKVATYDDEGVRHVIGLMDDVTQKQQDAGALQQALREAEEAGQARSAFVSNISHEIRTPLNGVLAGLDLLDARASSEVGEITAIIRASATALQARFEQLLSISRLDDPQSAGAVAVLSVQPLAERLIAPFRGPAGIKGIDLSVEIAADVPASVIGNGEGLERAIGPLIENAVKFTDRGSIRLRVDSLNEGWLRFSCIDTGAGFDPGEKEALFGAFHQRDSALTRRHGGMGLGLALARKHARAIGGTIDARSGPEGGAAFWLDCPLAAAPEDLGDASETVRVLVVDDHPTNRRIVELMLEDIAEVTAAEDGVEAVEAARHARFDVILMDIQMPRMDGITAVARIREDERATGRAPTPIIMLTANTQPEHMTASRAAGADRHLGKPFTAAGLISEIQNILT